MTQSDLLQCHTAKSHGKTSGKATVRDGSFLAKKGQRVRILSAEQLSRARSCSLETQPSFSSARGFCRTCTRHTCAPPPHPPFCLDPLPPLSSLSSLPWPLPVPSSFTTSRWRRCAVIGVAMTCREGVRVRDDTLVASSYCGTGGLLHRRSSRYCPQFQPQVPSASNWLSYVHYAIWTEGHPARHFPAANVLVLLCSGQKTFLDQR